MTIFPKVNSDFYSYQTDGDRDVKVMMERAYENSITVNQSFWSEADIDSRFKAGDQTLWNDIYGNIPSSRRKVFNFNRIRRICNMISGYQRRNRKSSVATPIESSDKDTANQFSKIILWAMNKDNTLETISEAFEGAITTGMNLLSTWMDYREDPINGDIRVDNVSYNGYLIDPFFKKHDLSDCNYIWTRKWLSKEQIKSLLPNRKEEISNLCSDRNKDGKFQFQPESYNQGIEGLHTYDEYWYRSSRNQQLLVDVNTGEVMEWTGKDEDLDKFLSKFKEITVINNEIQTTKLAIVVQGSVMYHGPNPMGIDPYPFVPVLAYYEPQITYFPSRIQGVVRGLRDSQYLYNRRKVIELDILESQINSGWKYKADSLVNPKDIFLQGQGRGVAIKQDAQMTDVEQIIPPGIPPSTVELSRILGEEIQQISGVNEELLGSADDDKSGILSMLRQGAGLTTLQTLFDQLDFSQKTLGRLFIQMIQKNFSPGKIKRIINEEPSLQFYSKAFGKFDIVIEEGTNTATQKQMIFQQQFALREAGIQISDEDMINASNIPNSKELIEKINQGQQQQQQLQQIKIQSEIEEQKAKIKDLEGRAEANAGLALERASRVQENRALAIERLAAAEKDRDLGTLDKVRAMKELDEMDISHIEKLFQVSQYFKEHESAQEKEEEVQVKSPNIEELAVMAEGEKNNKNQEQQQQQEQQPQL
jgi:hypothetical protein